MKDPVYRLLRKQVQALIDRAAPHAAVVIEVDERPDGKVVVIAREDIDGAYVVWTVRRFVEVTELNGGRYGIPSLIEAASEMRTRMSDA